MLSAGMLASRAFWIAIRRRRFPSGLPPPAFAATMISRASLVNVLPRSASIFPFFKRMLCHFECPDIPCSFRACARDPREDYTIRRGEGQRLMVDGVMADGVSRQKQASL